MQIVNIPSKAVQFKPIDLNSAHKLLQIAAQDIAQLEKSFNAISWLYHQLQKLPAALYFMPRVSSVKTFCNFTNQQITQLKSFSIKPSRRKTETNTVIPVLKKVDQLNCGQKNKGPIMDVCTGALIDKVAAL